MSILDNVGKNIKLTGSWGRDDSRDNIDNNASAGAVLFDASHGQFGTILLFKQFGTMKGCSFTLNSDITTHYTEANYHINDHWALQPEQYTLSGLIGEVIYTPPDGTIVKRVQEVKDFLSPLNIIAPTLDNYTQSAANVAKQINDNVKRFETTAKNFLNNIGIREKVSTSNQEYICKQLKILMEKRQLVSVYTPYGTLKDMAIVNISFNQDNTRFQSNVEISLQKWREAGSEIREATEEEKSELAKVQNAVNQQGGQAGTSNKDLKESSLLSLMQGYGVFK